MGSDPKTVEDAALVRGGKPEGVLYHRNLGSGAIDKSQAWYSRLGEGMCPWCVPENHPGFRAEIFSAERSARG